MNHSSGFRGNTGKRHLSKNGLTHGFQPDPGSPSLSGIVNHYFEAIISGMFDRVAFVGIDDDVVGPVVVVKKSGQRVSLRYFRRSAYRPGKDQGSVGKIGLFITVLANRYISIEAQVHRFARLPGPLDEVVPVLFRIEHN